MTDDSPEGEWISSAGQRLMIRIVAWTLTVFISFVALAAITGSRLTPLARAGFLGMVLLTVPLVWLMFRASNAGCRIEDKGLRIRGVLSNQLVPWTDISSVSLGRSGIYPYVGRVHLHDGSVVRIYGIQAPNISPSNSRTAALIEQLDREVRARSSGDSM